MRNISFWITQQSNCFFNHVSLPSAVAGIIHTTPLSVLAGISSHGKNHWISSPVKLWDLRRDTSSHKVAVFVGLILHWEKVGGGNTSRCLICLVPLQPTLISPPLGDLVTGSWPPCLPWCPPGICCCHPPPGLLAREAAELLGWPGLHLLLVPLCCQGHCQLFPVDLAFILLMWGQVGGIS